MQESMVCNEEKNKLAANDPGARINSEGPIYYNPD